MGFFDWLAAVSAVAMAPFVACCVWQLIQLHLLNRSQAKNPVDLSDVPQHERDRLRSYYKRHDKLTEASNTHRPTTR